MNQSFSADATKHLSPIKHRSAAAQKAVSMSAPDGSTEEWRYSPIDEFNLESLTPVLEQPDHIELDRSTPDRSTTDRSTTDRSTTDGSVQLAESYAAVATIIDGWVTAIEVDPAWVEKGLQVAAVDPTEADLDALDALDDSVTIFDYLHLGFSPQTLRIEAPNGLMVDAPIMIQSHQTGGASMTFPGIEVVVGEAGQLNVVELQTASAGAGLSVAHLRQTVSAAANLSYVTIQDLHDEHIQVARLASSVASQASLVGGYVAFGGKYARVRTDISLNGRGARGDLVAAYYGDGSQILDFRTFQHHKARDTQSDLLFKGSLDDKSGSIYTGLIKIHEDGAGSNAHQTNRNIKLSEDAWAWSVPNLEIENNDVRCSHATTVNPIDEEQQFYLQSRGVRPREADRLIVAGFFDEAINRLPIEGTRNEARRLIANKLNKREK